MKHCTAQRPGCGPRGRGSARRGWRAGSRRTARHAASPRSSCGRTTGPRTASSRTARGRPAGRGARRAPSAGYRDCTCTAPGDVQCTTEKKGREKAREKRNFYSLDLNTVTGSLLTTVFTARCYVSAVLAMDLCPSVTSRCSIETAERIELVFGM